MGWDPFSATQTDWERQAATTRGAVVLGELARSEPEIAVFGARSLRELYGLLGVGDGEPGVEHWRLTAALVRQFALDELVGLGLLVALSPGLKAIQGELIVAANRWLDRRELAQELLGELWSVLAELAGQTLIYPERNLLRLVRRRVEARLRREARWLSAKADEEELGGDQEPVDPAPLSVLEALGRSLCLLPGSLIARDDVRFLYRHHVLGYSFTELASLEGMSRSKVHRRCHDLEERLCCL